MAERQTVKTSCLSIKLIFLFLYAVTVSIKDFKTQLNVGAEAKITVRIGNLFIRSKGKTDCI